MSADDRTFQHGAIAEALERALQPPDVVVDPAELAQFLPLDYGMTLGVESTHGGRLWSCSIAGGDDHNAWLVARRSDDSGESWSEPVVMINPRDQGDPLRRRSLLGAFWTDPLGRLWLFVDQAITYFDGRAGTWVLRCDDPDGPAPSWSSAERIADGGVLNKPIVLSDGTWIVAGSLWDRGRLESPTRGPRESWRTNPFADAFHELDELRGVFLLVSTDEGRSWQPRGHVAIPNPEFDEPRLIERGDGTLWLTARAARDSITEAFSDDGGATWTEPAPSAIRHTSSRHALTRLASGRLLLIKHGRAPEHIPRAGARTDLCAFLSDDDGASWSPPLLLDDRAKVSYPDVTQLPDGTVCVTYDLNRNTEGRILMARFTEDDVRAGGALSSPLLVSEPDAEAMQARIARDRAAGEWAADRDAAAV